MLERNGFEVVDVTLFPINWGYKSLSSQLGVCEMYLNEIPSEKLGIGSTEGYSFQTELRRQTLQLRKYLQSDQLKDLGICFLFDWVVTAKLKR